jgi:spermidine synthase
MFARPWKRLSGLRPFEGVSHPVALTLLFFVLFFTGAASIMYEVVLLSFVTALVGITELSSGLVIGGFMAGLGLGAFLGAWYASRRLPLLIALSAAEFLIALYGVSFFALAEFVGVYSFDPLQKMLFIAWSLIFPALLMGLELPIAIEWMERYQGARAGLHTGIIYAGDTLGGVLGALTAGIFFIPMFGLEGAMIAGGIMNGAALFLIVALERRATTIAVILAVAFLAGASAVFAASRNYYAEANLSFFRLATGFYPIDAAHSPFQYSAILDHPQYGRSLYFDNQIFRGTASRELHEYSVLPAVNAHPDARQVLVIGGGDGGAVYQLVRAGIPHIVHVDIDENLVNLARKYLRGVNGGALDDPRVENVYMDGRAFLQDTDLQFDIIIVDVPLPRKAQLNHVWTKEFYELAKRHLNPGGIFVTHISSDQYLEAQAVILATVRSVFAHAYRYAHGNVGANAIQAKIIASDAYDPRIIRRKKPVEGDHWYESEKQMELFEMPPFERWFFDAHRDIISTDRNPALFQFVQRQYGYKAVRELEYDAGLPRI